MNFWNLWCYWRWSGCSEAKYWRTEFQKIWYPHFMCRIWKASHFSLLSKTPSFCQFSCCLQVHTFHQTRKVVPHHCRKSLTIGKIHLGLETAVSSNQNLPAPSEGWSAVWWNHLPNFFQNIIHFATWHQGSKWWARSCSYFYQYHCQKFIDRPSRSWSSFFGARRSRWKRETSESLSFGFNAFVWC